MFNIPDVALIYEKFLNYFDLFIKIHSISLEVIGYDITMCLWEHPTSLLAAPSNTYIGQTAAFCGLR